MARLLVAYLGTDQPIADLVCIPSLPRLYPAYQKQDCTEWLRDILQHKFKRVRMMSYEYDFAQGSDPKKSWNEFLDTGIHLLYALNSHRGPGGALNRPICFIGQGTGSLVLKSALILAKTTSEFRDIYLHTVGAVFSACHHDGNHPDFEEALLRCVRVELGLTKSKKSNILDALEREVIIQGIRGIMEQFRELGMSCPIRTFCEKRPTVWLSRSFRSDRDAVLCPASMTSCDWADTKVIVGDANHADMAKFPHRTSDLLPLLLNELEEILRPLEIQGESGAAPATDPEDVECIVQDTESLHITIRSSIFSSLITDGGDAEPAINTLGDPSPLAGHVNLPCYLYEPYRPNEVFEGRESILSKLETILNPTSNGPAERKVFTLSGLGGIGKTQTAIQYMFNNLDQFQAVCWVPAAEPTKLVERYVEFAVSLGLATDTTADQQETIVKLQNWFKCATVPWLVIFDNADGPKAQETLEAYLPRGPHGSILITSRDQAFWHEFGGEILPKLEAESAVSLLIRLIKRGPRSVVQNEAMINSARELAKRVDYLPLAIHVIAKLVHRSLTPVEEFARAYTIRDVVEDSSKARPFKDIQPYPYTLSTVWRMSYDALDGNQKTLLGILSFLDPDKIPCEILERGVKNPNLPKEPLLRMPRNLIQARLALLQSSLVDADEEFGVLRIHRVVQSFCHVYMDEQGTTQKAFDLAFSLVENVFPITPVEQRHNKTYWPGQQACVTHVQSLANNYSELLSRETPVVVEPKRFCSLLHNAAWYLYERGMFEPAYPLLKVAETIFLENPMEKTDSLLAAIVYVRACLETESNLFEDAYEDFDKQLKYIQSAIENGEMQRPCLQEVFALGGVGNGLQGINRFAEAEEFYKRSIEVYKEFGGELSAVSVVPTNLATCLWQQGRIHEAEDLLRGIVKDPKDTSNYRTGHAMMALGNVQISQGQELIGLGKRTEGLSKLEEAYETHLQTMRLFQATLGKSHHKVGDAAHKIACHLDRKHEYPNAIAMLTDAIEIYEQSPLLRNELARSQYKLGCVYQNAGMVAKGTQKIKHAEELRKKILGEKWTQAEDERDFDRLVMFWSR